jgi:hypothetical protein
MREDDTTHDRLKITQNSLTELIWQLLKELVVMTI